MISLALAVAMAMPRALVVQGDLLDKAIPNFDVKDMDFGEALKKLMPMAGARFWLSPEIQGKVTLSMMNTKLELVLQNLLTQVHGTYLYEGGTFLFVDRGNQEAGWEPPEDVAMPVFENASPTSQFLVKDSKLFLSRRNTKGGTYALLIEAAQVAGLGSDSVWAYGKSGYAIVLPFEAIDRQGAPILKDRFDFRIGRHYDFSRFGMAKLSDLFSTEFGNLDHDFRMIALTVTDVPEDSLRPSDQMRMREFGNRDLPYRFRSEIWARTPTVRALIYEFRRPPGQHLAVLLKPGESKLSAKQHLALAGIWSEKELR